MNRSFYVLATIVAIPALSACAALGAESAGATFKPDVTASPFVSPQVTVELKSRHSAIELAGAELCRYLGLMAGDGEAATVVEDPPKASATIALGLMTDFDLPMQGVRDAARDDAIYADVRDSKGVIAGSNPRSVLFAAYRFLEACGCRWIRPGKDGDYVPTRGVDKLTVRFSDQAAYRFRGSNNCGCFSLDQILDRIAWAPKVGMNTFFHEFMLPRITYNNYYDRRYPSHLPKEPRSDEEVRAYHELSIREIKRRGMSYHAVGHGWTALVLGLPESESDHGARPALPPGKEWLLAMVDGKRDFSRGPTFTDLCYGNPEVRRRIVRCVADYAYRHPEVDYLHVWNADGMNKTCECPLCRERRVSDLYVETLNGIDAELTRRGIATKIVFLVYANLLWPPERARLSNPDRFAMMFAPISRRYDTPYAVEATGAELPPYQLNQNKMPTDEHATINVLRSWQKIFSGEAFVFDYHMTWHHYRDPGYYGFTAVMGEDIRRLRRMGMEGFVSCQVPKAFFPHGYPTHLHARLLWNPQADTEELAREYFAGAFGEGSEEAREYMLTLSELFTPLYLDRATLSGKDAEAKQVALAKLARVPRAVADFRPVIARHESSGDAARRQSWNYLSLHGDIVLKLAEIAQARAAGKHEEAQVASRQLLDYLADHERELDRVLDSHWFIQPHQLGGDFRNYTPEAAPSGTGL
ncbi:MAG: DUF4838 domain-containing protein [Thermoguttaceae bacterium]|jgi:hypothetical protein